MATKRHISWGLLIGGGILTTIGAVFDTTGAGIVAGVPIGAIGGLMLVSGLGLEF